MRPARYEVRLLQARLGGALPALQLPAAWRAAPPPGGVRRRSTLAAGRRERERPGSGRLDRHARVGARRHR